jgi:hypothetical protein
MFSLPPSPARWVSVCALVFSLAATSTLAVTTITETIDLERLIRCIEAREGARWSHPGGALQFTRSTWNEFSTDPYHRASQPDKARQIARKALFLAIHRMQQDGIRPSVWLLALRWNCGYDGMLKRMREPWSYAEQVHNLYYDKTF